MRSVDEWIGKTDDAKVPRHVRARIFAREGGRCHLSGRLIRPGGTEAFAQALRFYCEDREARGAAGAAGLRISERYGWDRVNQKLVENYLRVIRLRTAGVRPISRAR